MSKKRRILNFILGLVTVLFALLILLNPEIGYDVMILVLGLTLLISGIRQIIYYFTMARLMVDGRLVLYRAAIVLNLGLFTAFLAKVPQQYAMVYLLGGMIFSGVIQILRSNEARQIGSGSWKRKLALGLLKLIAGIGGLFCLSSLPLVTLIYSAGLIGSGCGRIRSACRKTDIVYLS